MPEKELLTILKKSDKRNLATSLAAETGLGGLHAEEICLITCIDRNMKPAETSSKEVKRIIKALNGFMDRIKEPQGYMYADDITPFPFQNREVIKKFATYHQAIGTIKVFEKTSPHEKKIKAIEKTIRPGRGINKQIQKIEESTLKGTLVYEKYTPLQKTFRHCFGNEKDPRVGRDS